MMEIKKPIDIVDVKAGINVGRLFVQIKNGRLLLGDFQTGEAVLLSDVEVKQVLHARWNEEDGTCSACHHEACYDEWTEPKWDYDWDENLVQVGEENHIQFIFSPYCPNCGAQMDGEAE